MAESSMAESGASVVILRTKKIKAGMEVFEQECPGRGRVAMLARISQGAALAGAGMLLLVGIADPAGAQTGQGGNDGGGADAEDRRTPLGSLERLDQFDFIGMTQREMEKLYQNSGFGHDARITGFSPSMSTKLVKAAHNQGYRQRVQDLVGDMRALKELASRKKRLQEELDWARDFERTLEQSMDRLKEKRKNQDLPLDGPVQEAIWAEHVRLGQVKAYRKALEKWLENPMEGTD